MPPARFIERHPEVGQYLKEKKVAKKKA